MHLRASQHFRRTTCFRRSDNMPRSTSHRGHGVVGIPALVVALVVACDGGAPAGPTRPVQVISVDTLRVGRLAHVRGSGLTNLRSLLLDGFEATELVARSDSVVEFRVPSMRACESRRASVLRNTRPMVSGHDTHRADSIHSKCRGDRAVVSSRTFRHRRTAGRYANIVRRRVGPKELRWYERDTSPQ